MGKQEPKQPDDKDKKPVVVICTVCGNRGGPVVTEISIDEKGERTSKREKRNCSKCGL